MKELMALSFDPDRKHATWEHLYKHIYNEERWGFWGLFDFDNLVSGENGYELPIKQTGVSWTDANSVFKTFYELVVDRPSGKQLFTFSGDADFGMKGNQIVRYMEQPIAQMHMFDNFSIMPVSGGMNNKKGRFGLHDFLPDFIMQLSKFYESNDKGEAVKALLHLTGNPDWIEYCRKCNAEYLSLFKDVYDYCEKIYLVPKRVVDEMLVAAEQGYELDRYCQLARLFWNAKRKELLELIPSAELIWLDRDLTNDAYA